MSVPLYIFLVSAPVLIGLIVIWVKISKKNNHTELYSEGLRNENEGHYNLALQNYENALNEIRKLNINDKLGGRLAQRIKILRATMEYEKHFQGGDL